MTDMGAKLPVLLSKNLWQLRHLDWSLPGEGLPSHPRRASCLKPKALHDLAVLNAAGGGAATGALLPERG
jgi:hypothetical protein